MNEQEIQDFRNGLKHFTGTECWYRHPLMLQVLYTDGVKYVAERAGAYWLIDKVATLQLEPKVKAEEFQAWALKVKDEKAVLTCDDGNGNMVYEERIEYTDFPVSEMTFWVEMMDELQRCILLPSEH